MLRLHQNPDSTASKTSKIWVCQHHFNLHLNHVYTSPKIAKFQVFKAADLEYTIDGEHSLKMSKLGSTSAKHSDEGHLKKIVSPRPNVATTEGTTT